MFKSVYNPPPTPLKYHNIAKNLICIMPCTCATCISVAWQVLISAQIV